MEVVICGVFDSAAECYGRPMFVQSKGAAVRAFADEVNRPAQDNAMNQHPADFCIYYLGIFDDASGQFRTVLPELLARGADLVRSADAR